VSETQGARQDGDRRLTLRRAVALVLLAGCVTGVVAASGVTYLWPLALFPLVVGAVFFFELGSLAVTFWVGNVLVLHYSFREAATPQAVRQALVGTALFLMAGLLLGALQRRGHRAQARLQSSCLCDRLTGLYNYGTFVDYLHNEATKVERYGGQLCLIMLDLDRFKQFNDRHGHEAGNLLLRRVGATIGGLVRDADLAARYGGEEFAVLIRGDERDGFELAERLRRAVEATDVEVRGEKLRATISAGVASCPEGSADEGRLVERADAALYESKRRGRNRVTIHAGEGDQVEIAASLTA